MPFFDEYEAQQVGLGPYIDGAVAYYGACIEHNIREAPNLHGPFILHMAMKDRWVQAEVNELLEHWLATFCEPHGIDHVRVQIKAKRVCSAAIT